MSRLRTPNASHRVIATTEGNQRRDPGSVTDHILITDSRERAGTRWDRPESGIRETQGDATNRDEPGPGGTPFS